MSNSWFFQSSKCIKMLLCLSSPELPKVRIDFRSGTVVSFSLSSFIQSWLPTSPPSGHIRPKIFYNSKLLCFGPPTLDLWSIARSPGHNPDSTRIQNETKLSWRLYSIRCSQYHNFLFQARAAKLLYEEYRYHSLDRPQMQGVFWLCQRWAASNINLNFCQPSSKWDFLQMCDTPIFMFILVAFIRYVHAAVTHEASTQWRRLLLPAHYDWPIKKGMKPSEQWVSTSTSPGGQLASLPLTRWKLWILMDSGSRPKKHQCIGSITVVNHQNDLPHGRTIWSACTWPSHLQFLFPVNWVSQTPSLPLSVQLHAQILSVSAFLRT